MKLSAHLANLWPDLELVDAMIKARKAGFCAVELHWPYVTEPLDVALAAESLGLEVIWVDTSPGNLAKGDYGLGAVSQRRDQARASVDKAVAYAVDVSAQSILVLAGRTKAKSAFSAMVATLTYACERAGDFQRGVLIEPLTRTVCPDYFLNNPDQAASLIEAVGCQNLRLVLNSAWLFDGGRDLDAVSHDLLGHIGHVRLGSEFIGERGPDDLIELFSMLGRGGYTGWVGIDHLGLVETIKPLIRSGQLQAVGDQGEVA